MIATNVPPLPNMLAPTQQPVSRLRSILGGSLGNLVEWYDWFAYSAFSLYFAKSFFPSGDRTAQLLSTAAIFAVGFLIRPLGGWILGIWADRNGRKSALTLSVLLMGGGSLLVAIAPPYRSAGLISPLLLLVARLLQGLSVGGEYAASATYLCEMAPPGRRGFYSSFQYSTMILGQLLALGLLLGLERSLLTREELEAWGWRIPFVLGALAALGTLALRRRIEETPSFTQRDDPGRRCTLLGLLRTHPRAALTVAGLTLGGTVSFYTFSTYMQKYLVNSRGWSPGQSTALLSAVLFIFMLLQPVIGSLSDRIGRRPILLAFGILGTVLSAPLLWGLARVESFWGAFFLILTALVIVSGYTSTSAAIKAELFPAKVRALGIGLPHALAVSLFGGTAEVVALGFKKVGWEGGYSAYVAISMAVSLVVAWSLRETRSATRRELP